MGAILVANSGGHPLLSWSALAGATSYKVALVVTETQTNRMTLQSNTYVDEYPLGSTSGSSFLDTADTHTGLSMCMRSLNSVVYREVYRYRVTAIFADGTSLSTTLAPMAQC